MTETTKLTYKVKLTEDVGHMEPYMIKKGRTVELPVAKFERAKTDGVRFVMAYGEVIHIPIIMFEIFEVVTKTIVTETKVEELI